MSVQHLLATTHVMAQSSGAYLTAGRFWSLVAVLLGLVGVIVGGRALARSRRVGVARRNAVVALVAGMAGTGIAGVVVAAAEGGPGTGYGIVGGFMGLVVGLVAMVLAGLALRRRTAAARA